MEKRIEKIREELGNNNLDGIIINHPSNRFYLSGFTGSAGTVMVTAKKAMLITDFRYTEQAQNQAPHLEIIEHDLKKTDTLNQLISGEGLNKIGFEADFETFATVEQQLKGKIDNVEWVPTQNLVEKFRIYKNAAELSFLQEAIDLADQALEHICGFIKPGMAEREVALELEFFLRKKGAKGSSFDIIVASGPRGSLPHGIASDKIIKEGELVVIDMGARLNGYASDVTRTFAIGSAGEKERKIYETVLEAQLAAIEGIKPGLSGQAADKLSRDVISAEGYGDNFGHGLGHGIGIDVHESPRLSPVSENNLEPGMVFTVEPGIYLPGWGGVRIEDIVVMEENGVRSLTGAPKEFKII